MEARMLRERQNYRDLKDQYVVVSKQHTTLQNTVRRAHQAIVDHQDGKRCDVPEYGVGHCDSHAGSENTPSFLSLEHAAENMYATVQRYIEMQESRIALHKAINQCRRRVKTLTNKHSKMVDRA